MPFRLPDLTDDARYLAAPDELPKYLSAVAVIPARDEARRVVTCLEGLRCQWNPQFGSMHQQVAAVLVVNGTRDATAFEAMKWQAIHPTFALFIVDVQFARDKAHVGSARRLGLDVAAALLEQTVAEAGLLFSTDADSRLAPTALSIGIQELSRADAFGAHIVAGEEDASVIGLTMNRYNELKAQLRFRHYRSAHERHPQHGVFGGAGFGVSLHAYRAVGGLPQLAYDEDQEMRRRLLGQGFRVSYPKDIVVYTSTRTTGRTPWGMAKQLEAWERDAERNAWPEEYCAEGLVEKYDAKARTRNAWAVTNSNEAFEQYWQREWHRLMGGRPQSTPKVPLPEAVASLEVYLARSPQARSAQ